MEDWKCPYCNNIIMVENKFGKSVHTRVCSKAIEKVNNLLTKKFLKEEYIDKGKSSYAISKETGISNSKIIKKLEEYKIKIRNCKEAGQSNLVKAKRKDSTIKKYGTKNVLSNGSKVRETMEKNLIEKYGVDTVFKLDSIQGQCRISTIEKYGGLGSASDSILTKMKKTCMKNNGVEYGIHCIPRITKPHKIILDILDTNHIEYEVEKKLLDGKYRADILINKKIIEINGDFFHANPDKYNPNDILNIFGTKLYAAEIWEQDRKRNEMLESNNYEVLVLWEYEINNKIEECKDKIWKFLK